MQTASPYDLMTGFDTRPEWNEPIVTYRGGFAIWWSYVVLPQPK